VKPKNLKKISFLLPSANKNLKWYMDQHLGDSRVWGAGG